MLRYSRSLIRSDQIFGLIRSNETHDVELFCELVVHFGAAVGSVTEAEQAVADATARARTA